MSNYAPEKSVFPGFDKDRIDYFFFFSFFPQYYLLILLALMQTVYVTDFLFFYADFISLLEKNILNNSGLWHKVLWLLICQVLLMQSLVTWDRDDFATAIVMNIFKIFCFISYSLCKWNHIYINGGVLPLVFKLPLNTITATSPTHRWTFSNSHY